MPARKKSRRQADVEARPATKRKSASLSLLDLRGLGKEHWQKIDAERYVSSERDAWDSEKTSQ